jgi:outer membrane protein TolC
MNFRWRKISLLFFFVSSGLIMIPLLLKAGASAEEVKTHEVSQAASQTPNRKIKFTEALRRMEERNTELEAQRIRIKKFESEQLASRASFFPSLEGQLSDLQVTRPGFSRTQTGMLVGRINLFRSGADVASLRSSRLTVSREKELLKQAELDAEQKNVNLVIEYFQSAFQMKLAENILSLSEELDTIEEARYRRGLIPLQESQRSKVEKSNALARLSDAKSGLEEIKAKLDGELGTDEVELVWPWKDILTSIAQDEFLAKKLNLALSPVWKATQVLVEKEEELLKSKFRNFLPSIDLTMGYGYPDYDRSRDFHSETTLTVTIPLFDLSKHAGYELQLQEKSLALVTEEKVKRSIQVEWEQTRANLVEAIKSAKEREQSLQLAKSLHQDNKRRLQAGRSSMNDILVDQNRLVEAERLAIEGWVKSHVLYSKFCHLLGKKGGPDCFH